MIQISLYQNLPLGVREMKLEERPTLSAASKPCPNSSRVCGLFESPQKCWSARAMASPKGDVKIDDAHGEVSSGQPSNLWGAQTVAFMLAIGLYEPGCKL